MRASEGHSISAESELGSESSDCCHTFGAGDPGLPGYRARF